MKKGQGVSSSLLQLILFLVLIQFYNVQGQLPCYLNFQSVVIIIPSWLLHRYLCSLSSDLQHLYRLCWGEVEAFCAGWAHPWLLRVCTRDPDRLKIGKSWFHPRRWRGQECYDQGTKALCHLWDEGKSSHFHFLQDMLLSENSVHMHSLTTILLVSTCIGQFKTCLFFSETARRWLPMQTTSTRPAVPSSSKRTNSVSFCSVPIVVTPGIHWNPCITFSTVPIRFSVSNPRDKDTFLYWTKRYRFHWCRLHC